MIVRLMGEGQFRVDDGLLGQLNELDDRAQSAADADDEPELDRVLDEMWQLVQAQGERLSDDDLTRVGRASFRPATSLSRRRSASSRTRA